MTNNEAALRRAYEDGARDAASVCERLAQTVGTAAARAALSYAARRIRSSIEMALAHETRSAGRYSVVLKEKA